jgi:lysophospholipase L1-like esterase
MEFVGLLRHNHPLSAVYYSCPFPRTLGTGMSDEQRIIYNRVASRLGAMARSAARHEGFGYILNGCLWMSVRKWRENPEYFQEDGLHLNAVGREVVAQGWVLALST